MCTTAPPLQAAPACTEEGAPATAQASQPVIMSPHPMLTPRTAAGGPLLARSTLHVAHALACRLRYVRHFGMACALGRPASSSPLKTCTTCHHRSTLPWLPNPACLVTYLFTQWLCPKLLFFAARVPCPPARAVFKSFGPRRLLLPLAPPAALQGAGSAAFPNHGKPQPRFAVLIHLLECACVVVCFTALQPPIPYPNPSHLPRGHAAQGTGTCLLFALKRRSILFIPFPLLFLIMVWL